MPMIESMPRQRNYIREVSRERRAKRAVQLMNSKEPRDVPATAMPSLIADPTASDLAASLCKKVRDCFKGPRMTKEGVLAHAFDLFEKYDDIRPMDGSEGDVLKDGEALKLANMAMGNNITNENPIMTQRILNLFTKDKTYGAIPNARHFLEDVEGRCEKDFNAQMQQAQQEQFERLKERRQRPHIKTD